MVFTYSVFGYVPYVLQVVYHVCILTGISKSQMNEMVNLIPTCIVSGRKKSIPGSFFSIL